MSLYDLHKSVAKTYQVAALEPFGPLVYNSTSSFLAENIHKLPSIIDYAIINLLFVPKLLQILIQKMTFSFESPVCRSEPCIGMEQSNHFIPARRTMWPV